MHRSLLSFLALLCALGAAAVHAGEPSARDIAEAVARTIEDNYFDVDLGRRHAADLRAEAARGAYDGDDTEAAAVAMTDFLRERDRHFAVRRGSGAGPARVRIIGPAGAASGPRPAGAIIRRGPGEPAIARVDVLDGDIGYVDIRSFAGLDFDDAADPTRRAIDDAVARVRDTRAIVLDLRGNRGGSPAMVGYLASAFTAAGADIFNTFHSRLGAMSERPAVWHAHPCTDVPLYLLVDAATGSAAESFAYTLKHSGRATVIGASTRGAANPGRPFDLGNGYEVFVSTGTPRNPNTQANWEGVGVQPDIAADGDALAVALERARARG